MSREYHEAQFITCVLHDDTILATSTVDPDMLTIYRPALALIVKLSAKGRVRKSDVLFVGDDRVNSLITPLDPYTSANWEFYQKQIFDAWAKERMDEACAQAMDLPYPANVETMERVITLLAMKSGAGKTVTADTLIIPAIQRIMECRDAGGIIPGISFGLPLIDSATLGAQEGQMILICGRPSDGKSSLGWQLARRQAKTAVVGYITLEDSKEDLINRGLAAEAQIDSRAVLTGKFLGAEEAKLGLGTIEFQKYAANILIHEKPGMKLQQLHSEIRSMVRSGAKVIYVDYLQLVQVDGPEPKHEKMARISVTTKALARELKTPIVAMAQLKRPEGNERKPSLQDIQHSDQFGQDADQAWLLWHPDPQKQGDERQSFIIVRKARNGAPRTVKIKFDRPTLTITEEFGQ